jgi:hypothetical protein
MASHILEEDAAAALILHLPGCWAPSSFSPGSKALLLEGLWVPPHPHRPARPCLPTEPPPAHSSALIWVQPLRDCWEPIPMTTGQMAAAISCSPSRHSSIRL